MLWAEAAELASPLGPDGPPSNISWYLYGGKYVYTWDNYDSAYETQVSIDSGATVLVTKGAGVTEWNSGSPSLTPLFVVRHRQGGLFSSWAGIE